MQLLKRVFPSLFYGWVTVTIAFAVFVVISGVWGSFAVFYVALIEEFGWSRAETAGAFSVYMVVLGLTAPVAGWLVDRLGPRRLMPFGAAILAVGLALASRLSEPWHLYLLYGGVIALGQNCVGFIPHLRVISNWFHRLRGAAFGIATSGMGIGTLILLPIVQYLILQFGWRQAYLAMAAIVLLLAPLTGFLHRERPSDMGLLPDGDSWHTEPTEPIGENGQPATPVLRLVSPFFDASLKKAASTVNFWAMFASNVFFGVATIVLVVQVAHIVEIGFDPLLAASVSGLVGLLVALGRLLGGIFSDRIGKATTGLVGVFLLSLGVSAVVLAGSLQQELLLFAYGLLYGLGWGFFGIVGAAITAYLFQGRSYGTIAGLLELGVGVGGFFGPLLGGYLFDQLGSYTIPLIIAVASAWIGGACFKLAFRGIK